ncbi:MAG TPA: STAS domain-containing protein [Oligoflexia bacterium]|nr:STAS domain-containing protein [Oligoflexia bacterium]HMP48699.1 STAS domain-containing protein [Oligoflexia bacterium]
MENKKQVLIVKPESTRIDAAFALQLKNQILDSYQSGANTIVLDLSEVDFIDSSGLGALVASRKTMGKDGEIALCEVKDRVQSLFTVTRMNKVFRIFNTKEDAVNTLQNV